MSNRFELIHEVVGPRQVPTVTIQSQSASDIAPRVIVIHGLQGHKEKYLEELYLLARDGYKATAIDMFLHGERANSTHLPTLLETDFGQTIQNVIYETAADISSLLDFWNVEQVALWGVSAGGLVAHAATVADPRITVLASIISSPDWNTADATSHTPVDSDAYKFLYDLSPVNHPQRYVGCAVLLLVGDDDDVVSPGGCHLLHDRLTPLFAERGDEDRLKLVSFHGVGHEYSYEMRQLSLAWIHQHLKYPAQ